MTAVLAVAHWAGPGLVIALLVLAPIAVWREAVHNRAADERDQAIEDRDQARRGERQAHARLDVLRTFVAHHLDHFIPAQRTPGEDS